MSAQEGLYDAHLPPTFGARLLLLGVGGIVTFGLNWRLVRFRIKQASDRLYSASADAIREEACMSDAMEARGQDVDQEPADELVSWQAHDPHVITAFDAVVFPPEGHGVGLGADEAMVGDRHTMRVTAEVSLHGLGATEGWFGIDNPIGFAQRYEMGSEDAGISQLGEIVEEPQLACLVQSSQPFQEQASEQPRQDLYRQEEP